MLIDKVYGVSINNLKSRFKKEIKQLKNLGISSDEIESDLYTTICICTDRFSYDKSSNFFKYLIISISKNFKRKIYAITLSRKNEFSLLGEQSYEEVDPADLEMMGIVSKLDPEVLAALTKYCKGAISETDLIKLCQVKLQDASSIIELVQNFLGDD